MEEKLKSLTAEIERDLGATLNPMGKPVSSVQPNGSTPKTARLSDRIDSIIDELNIRIEVLRKLKESL